MKIKERIITLIEEQKDEKSANLWNICQKIIDNINAHNKQIIAQMQEYDTHDQEHSEKVLEIMENILDPTTIEKMSFYELILLYMSAYLHDSAMAMPNWEYTLLRAVEGTEEYNDSTLSFKICNDYKRVHTFSEALDMVQNNKDKLFDYEKARQYVCMKPTEEALIESLAELMCSYEEFRNGYTEELDGCKDSVSKYMNKSKFIRSEFIRQTHHIRVVDNVYALKGKIADAIGGFYAESFVEDLAAVCRCHGEKLEKIFELPIARKDWSDENANIQFLAILLRLGDVIHFDSERAPMSLYAEKQISDAESYKHWNAKFQELQYTVHNENSKVSIRYQAYCREPEMYYFIQDYLDGIDNEIDNYYILKNRWELIQNRELERYYLNIDKVDRTQIKYDRDRFVPDKNMKFVLNQSKILELLMGIQLYKDKFLCIREIYQNALDASKCMKAYNRKLGKTENLTIQFGVGVEEIQGKTEKYIYCLDHGTGMNEYIIRNYLLHIGNSYYKSKEFAKKNTDWGYDVNPTSQFGIGLLSGYMLADKIGITTIHYEDNKALSFVLIVATAVSIYFTLYAKESILLLAGKDFLPAVGPMVILMPTVLLIGLSNITGIQILTPRGEEIKVVYSVTAGAVLDFVFNLILIPKFGADGAAFSTLMAEVLVLAIQGFGLRKELKGIVKEIQVWKIILGLAGATAAGYFAGALTNLGIFFTLCVSALFFFGTYGIILLMLRETFVTSTLESCLRLVKKRG